MHSLAYTEPHSTAGGDEGNVGSAGEREGEEKGGLRGKGGRGEGGGGTQLYRAMGHAHARACALAVYLPSRQPPPSGAAHTATWLWPWRAPVPARPPLARRRRLAPRRALARRACSAQLARRCARTWGWKPLRIPNLGRGGALAPWPLGKTGLLSGMAVSPESATHPEATVLNHLLSLGGAGWRAVVCP